MAKFRYQHIKSSVEGKAPTAAQIKVAEIGVNDFAGDEKLFIKNSEGEVVDLPRGYSRQYLDDKERVIAESLVDLNDRKLDASAYTPTDLTNYYTKSETSGATEIAAAFNDKLDASAYTPTDLTNYYTKSETSGATELATAFNGKQNVLTAGEGIDITNDVISVTGGSTDIEEQLEVIAASLNDLEDRKLDKTEIPDLGNLEEVIAAALNDLEERKANEADLEEIGEATAYALNDLECRKADNDEVEEQFEVIAASLNDLEDRKLDKTEIPDLGNLEEVIAAALNDLEERKADKDELDDEFESITSSLNDINDNKLDVSAYTPVDLSNYYTKSETSGASEVADALNDKLDTSAYTPTDLTNYYTKSETSGASEIATAFNDKLDTSAYTPTDLSNYYTKSETSGATELTTAFNDKLDASAYTPTDLSNYYTKSETSGASEIQDALDENERIVAEALNDLNGRKLDASAYTPTDLTNYYTKSETSGASEIQDALDEKADASNIPSVSGYADAVQYNSTSKYVEFYHGGTGGTKVFEYDASPFLVDGMVESVVVTSVTSGASTVEVLEITWNSAAGSQVTDIPLSDIFDSSLYYTKSETSGASEIQDALDGKSDSGHTHDDRYYTKSETSGATEIENALNDIVSSLTITVDTAIDENSSNPIANSAITTVIFNNERIVAESLNDLNERKLDASAYSETDLSDYYTKDETSGATEISTALSGYYTKGETSGASEISSALLEYYTKSETSGATELEAALSGKVDTNDIADFFDNAVYELSGTTHVINFYNGNTIKATIDATDFIKDGMIDSVSVETSGDTSVLVITWNTDAGKSQTILNVGDIFESDNYYTKDETSGATEITEALSEIDDLIDALDENKLDASAYTQVDLSNYYTKNETSGATEISTAISDMATKSADLDNVKLKKITQSDYDSLVQAGTTDANTLYIITD